MALLEVERLQTHFGTSDGVVRAVEGLSFHIEAGETLAIVGESGCGKSVTSLSILRLIQEPPGKMAGAIRFMGRDLLKVSEGEMRKLRGNEISMIFQEPMTSLNPVLTIGRQIGETLRLHQGMNARQAEARAVDMLTLVGIPAPGRRVREYPHQLSGGMRQRVMIAMALACNPKLLIADEPTTALDVTIQAQILDLMRDLKTRLGSAIMLITHDLGVVAEMAQRVVVMYAGRKVEEAPVNEIFANPQHPYTRGLLGAVPKLGSSLSMTWADEAGGDPGAGAVVAEADRRLCVRGAVPECDGFVPGDRSGGGGKAAGAQCGLPLRGVCDGGRGVSDGPETGAPVDLRSLGARMDRSEMRRDRIDNRIAVIGSGIASIHADLSTLHQGCAGTRLRLDSNDHRVTRIERRLDLVGETA